MFVLKIEHKCVCYLTTYTEIKKSGPQLKFNFYDLDTQDVSKQKEMYILGKCEIHIFINL